MSTTTLQGTWTVSTIHGGGWILADLYDGPDASRRDAAIARGVAAMQEESSPIAYVRVDGPDRTTERIHGGQPNIPEGAPVEWRTSWGIGLWSWVPLGTHLGPVGPDEWAALARVDENGRTIHVCYSHLRVTRNS